MVPKTTQKRPQKAATENALNKYSETRWHHFWVLFGSLFKEKWSQRKIQKCPPPPPKKKQPGNAPKKQTLPPPKKTRANPSKLLKSLKQLPSRRLLAKLQLFDHLGWLFGYLTLVLDVRSFH